MPVVPVLLLSAFEPADHRRNHDPPRALEDDLQGRLEQRLRLGNL